MGNCLKKQYFGVVQNSELPKFGVIYVPVNAISDYTASYNFITIRTAKASHLHLDSQDGYMALSTADLSNPSARFRDKDLNAETDYTIYFTNNDGVLEIHDGYSLKKLFVGDFVHEHVLSVTTDLFEYRTDLEQLSGGKGITGDVSKIGSNKMLVLRTNYVEGNIASVISRETSLQNLLVGNKVSGNLNGISFSSALATAVFDGSANVVGDISYLAAVRALTTLEINRTGIYGSIEDYVATKVSVGETSVSNRWALGFARQLTFGGSTHDYTYSILEWNGTSKIYLYCGGDSKESCNTVYAKGATAEEIAAWEGAGKTVHVIS